MGLLALTAINYRWRRFSNPAERGVVILIPPSLSGIDADSTRAGIHRPRGGLPDRDLNFVDPHGAGLKHPVVAADQGVHLNRRSLRSRKVLLR